MNVDTIIESMHEVGKNLIDDPLQNAADLRQIMNELEFVTNEVNADCGFVSLCYFLDLFLKDVWVNIASDSSLRLSDDNLEDILKDVGIGLCEISRYAENANFYISLESLTYKYLLRLKGIDLGLEVR